MQTYIGCKIIKAEPMAKKIFECTHKNGGPYVDDGEPGYCVKYPDGYVSWSPKDAFENAYRELTEPEKAFI